MKRLLLLLGVLLISSLPVLAQSAGCGAGGIYPNIVAYDQSSCGNVTTDGTPESYESSYNDSSATVINQCGATIRNSGSYKLSGNLACTASGTAISIEPSSNTGIYLNLKGFTVTGRILVNDYSGALRGGVSVFNGLVNCNAGECLRTENSNGSAPYTAPVTYHHLTITNSNDNCSGISVDGRFSGLMSGAGTTGPPYSDVFHHLTINVNGGTATSGGATSARCGGGGVAGAYRTVHIYNNKIVNGDANTNHYTEGFDCYNTYSCDVHNNYFRPNVQTTGDTPGRLILLDGDAYGNGSDNTYTTGMNRNSNIYNNYFCLNGDRAIRHRSAQNAWVHENLMDCVMGSDIGLTTVYHFGDLTAAGPGGTGIYDLGASLVEKNRIIYTGPNKSIQPAVFSEGLSAIGIKFTDNRVSCSGTGCSSLTDTGLLLSTAVHNVGTGRYTDTTVCNVTYDSPLPSPQLTVNGSGQTQTSYIRYANAGTCSASGGAQCVAAGALCTVSGAQNGSGTASTHFAVTVTATKVQHYYASSTTSTYHFNAAVSASKVIHALYGTATSACQVSTSVNAVKVDGTATSVVRVCRH